MKTPPPETAHTRLDPAKARRLVEAVSNAESSDAAISACEIAFSFLVEQLHALGEEANGYPRRPIAGQVWQAGYELATVCDRFANETARWNQRRGEEQATGLAAAMALQVVGHYPEEIFPRVLRNARCREALGRIDDAIPRYQCVVGDFRTLRIEDDIEDLQPLSASHEVILNAVVDALRALQRLRPDLPAEDLELLRRLEQRIAHHP